MRLIDADGLKIAIRHELDIAEQIADDEADIYISKMIEEAFFDIIDNTITIEPELKKGKWIVHPEVKNVYGGTYIECSQCGEKYVVQHMEDEKYCRNCGAKMEAEG